MALSSEDISEALAVIGCYITQETAGTKGIAWANEVSDALKAELSRIESRHEQRRARKAAKDREMYKTFGRRPWADGAKRKLLAARPDNDMVRLPFLDLEFDHDDNDYVFLRLSVRMRHRERMEYLREPSGFKQMSRLAEEMRK